MISPFLFLIAQEKSIDLAGGFLFSFLYLLPL